MYISRRAVAILALSAVIQVALSWQPDTMGDLLEYHSWARTLTQEGLAAAYWPTSMSQESLAPIDYPPLVPYVLWATGRCLGAVSQEALLHNDQLLDFLIRLPFCAFVLLIALLVYLDARRIAPNKADLICALVALNPALIFDTAYWGQSDSVCAFFVMLAVVLLVRGRPEWSWVAITCAALVKPLAYPFMPLILLETWKRFSVYRTFSSATASALVAGIVFTPFAWIGRLGDGVSALVSEIDAMPYISVDAHNLWWIVGRGLPWTKANAHPLGISWNTLSLVLFGTFFAITLVRLWRSKEPRALYVAAAATGFGFFILATRVHENHLFVALPLMALLAANLRWPRMVLIALTITFFANMLLHDPFLDDISRRHVPGPHFQLPALEEPQDEIVKRYRSFGYGWIADEVSGDVSLVGFVATLVNAQANVVLFALWLSFAYFARSFDVALATSDWHVPWQRAGPAITIFVLATGIYFLTRVSDSRHVAFSRASLCLRSCWGPLTAISSGPYHIARLEQQTTFRLDYVSRQLRQSDTHAHPLRPDLSHTIGDIAHLRSWFRLSDSNSTSQYAFGTR